MPEDISPIRNVHLNLKITVTTRTVIEVSTITWFLMWIMYCIWVVRNSRMFDELWSEIQDMPGEIFDIEDFKVDVKDPCQIALEHDAKLLEIHNAWLTLLSWIVPNFRINSFSKSLMTWTSKLWQQCCMMWWMRVMITIRKKNWLQRLMNTIPTCSKTRTVEVVAHRGLYSPPDHVLLTSQPNDTKHA